MIKELLDGLKSRLKGVGEKGSDLPPAGGLPPSPLDGGKTQMPTAEDAVVGTKAEEPSDEDFAALLSGGTSELDDKIKELENKTIKLESTVNKTLEVSESNSKRLDSIDTNMKKFLSLYEIVTNQINPFVDSPQEQRRPMMVRTDGESEKEKVVVPSVAELEKQDEQMSFDVEEEGLDKILGVKEPVKEEVPEIEEVFQKPEPKIETPVAVDSKPAQDIPQDGEQVMFLQSIKDGHASFVLEWITSLVEGEAGLEKNTKLLRYLFDLGWITPKAYEALMAHIMSLARAGKIAQAPQKMAPLTVGGYGPTEREQAIPTPTSLRAPMMPFGMPNPKVGDQDSVVTVFKWVKYLVDTVGVHEAHGILEYMVELGWITKEAHGALVDYIHQQKKIEEMAKLPMQDANARILMSPDKIPSPAEFMARQGIPQARAEPPQFRVPIQSATQRDFFQMPQQIFPPKEQPVQRPIEKPKTNNVIPLTELGQDIDSLAIILEWIRYLVDRAGTQGTKDIFNYYTSIGWVDSKVNQKLEKYVEGIRATEQEEVGYQPTVEDHATSLFFISKLKNIELSEEDIAGMLGG